MEKRLSKEEMMIKFEKNVAYLKRNVPPDDIYMFAEQTFMAAMFFLFKWGEHGDIIEECKQDSVTKKWVNNIVGFQICKDRDEDMQLDLDLKSIEEE